MNVEPKGLSGTIWPGAVAPVQPVVSIGHTGEHPSKHEPEPEAESGPVYNEKGQVNHGEKSPILNALG